MNAATTTDPQPRYGRVVLKLSGESFSRAGERGIGMEEVLQIARQVQKAAQSGCQIALVIGGGNILRGAHFTDKNAGINEATAHSSLAAAADAVEELEATAKLYLLLRHEPVRALSAEQVAELRRRFPG